ncbi:MAG TPA: RNB domain-containing ribonuclease [Pyrinomonadaceae bacterium]|nr:RNB domain-containing ribonuclease [Pyrinomonadaceae bacterium]
MSQLTISELTRLARRALIEEDFAPDFPPRAAEAVLSLDEKRIISEAADSAAVKDLRGLLWSSIDNASSRDLDQLEYAEKLPGSDDVRLLVAIADVDEFVPKDSPIDVFAAENTLSIYTGSGVFPMLPERLSNDLTSLLEGADRLAVVTEIIVSRRGDVETVDVFRALVHNYAKLSYEETGAWLEGGGEIPARVAEIPGMKAQILLQQEAAQSLRRFRKQNGALEFETVEAKPVVEGDRIIDLKVEKRSAARDIIENFMVTTNVETAEFLEKRSAVSLRRVVKTPERWRRIVEIARSFNENLPENPDSFALAEFLLRRRTAEPALYADLSLSIIKLLGASEYVVQRAGAEDAGGHFGLAVSDYTHSTAPNRRYADLIVQRLVKAALAGEPAPYDFEELEAIAARCNERESAARKVERRIRKTIAASVMAARIGETFEAVVTGVAAKGTFARITTPPVDGRIVSGEAGLQVGEKVVVRLLKTEPERGFIDFAREGVY